MQLLYNAINLWFTQLLRNAMLGFAQRHTYSQTSTILNTTKNPTYKITDNPE